MENYVTDRGNNRIQVLNSDLTYSHSFGSKGSQPGEFNYADGITVDNEGMVYVADVNGRRIQKFTPNGDILTIIDRKGEKGDALKQPFGLCFDNNNILHVTDLDDTVYMFTTCGKFLGYVGSGDGSSFKQPWFIVSDQFGKLYIGDENGVISYC